MKKFSKLLAVVLAIAVIICPMMIFAETSTSSGTYKIELVDANTVQLTINSTDGFVAYHAIVGFNRDDAFQSSYNDDGYVDGLKVISYTLKTAQANDHNAPTIRAHASGTSLNVIVMPSDTNNLDLCTKIVIGIRVASGATASLTKIQAADNGTVDSDNANLLTFPAAGSDGVIDTKADDYDAANAVAAHVHTVVEDAAVAPTCTETGLTAGSHCSVCNEVLVAQTVVPALGHSFTNYVSNNDATCTQDGTKTAYCDHECGTSDTIVDEDSALGHTPAAAVVENEVAATCTTDGSYDSVVKCSVCKTELSRETVNVPATGHTPATAVEENRVEPTCGVAGSYDSVVYCSVCKAEISRDTIVIPATNDHTWGEWTTDADGHSRTCSVCNTVDSGTHDGNPCSVCGYEAAPAEIPVDSNIVCVSGGGLGTSAYISFYFTKASLSADYKSFEFMVTRNVSGAGYMFTNVTEEVTDTATTSTRLYYYVRGIELYAMSIPITGVLYCKDANGNVIAKSQEFTTTLADSLYAMYTKSTNAKQRRALADVIIAGAEAQRFVTASASDSDLGKMVLPTEGKVLEDASDSLEEMAAYNINNSAAPYTIGVGGGIGASPYLTFNFSGISNPDNYYVKLSYYNAIEGTEKEKIVYLNDTNTDIVKKSGTKYYVYYKEMAIPATNAAVTAELYQIGESEPISSYTYCLDAFFESRKTNSAMGTLVVALAKLGQSFRAFNAK